MSILDAVDQWYPDVPKQVLHPLFATSLDPATVKRMVRVFCRLTDEDDPDGVCCRGFRLKRDALSDVHSLADLCSRTCGAAGRVGGTSHDQCVELDVPCPVLNHQSLLTVCSCQEFSGCRQSVAVERSVV